jgi:uncharacterized protein (TIGR02271 family)
MAYETTNAAGVGTATHVVVGLFNHASNAHQAVSQLRASGFSSNQIGAAFRDQASTGVAGYSSTAEAGHAKENWWEKVKDAFRPEEDKVEARREVATGTTLNADPYARGDYEYDFAGDDFQDSLTATGIAPDRAAYLTRSLRPGGAIVTVRDTDRASEAEHILSANGGTVRHEDTDAIDAADSTGQAITDTGYTETEYAEEERPLGTPGTSTNAVDRVQLFGEVLRVHKERIKRGEARIRKDVVTENQTIDVPVTREELVLERVPVSGTTPAPGASIGSPQEIRVPLSEDAVRLEKQAVVREEVLVGKREVENVASVGDAVRHEKLRVDPDGETPARSAIGEKLGEKLGDPGRRRE